MKKHRMDLMLSQYELADLASVARHRIQIAENGIPVLSSAEVRRIAKIFGMKQIPGFLEMLIDVERESET